MPYRLPALASLARADAPHTGGMHRRSSRASVPRPADSDRAASQPTTRRAERPAMPHPGTSAEVHALQRQAGNQAVSQLLSGREQLTVQRQVPPAPPALAHPVLRQGSHGEQVSQAQRKLSRVRASALPLTEDGSFGALTAAAVRAFQATSGI